MKEKGEKVTSVRERRREKEREREKQYEQMCCVHYRPPVLIKGKSE
jgi:hypothetical protein